MTYRDIDTVRLKYILTYGLDQAELRTFFKQLHKPLIQAGEKLQNLPEYPSDRVSAVLRFGQKANVLFERWCQKNVAEEDIEQADAIVDLFQAVEDDARTLTDDERHHLSRSILVHLTGPAPSERLLNFMRSAVAGSSSESDTSVPAHVNAPPDLAPLRDDLSAIAMSIANLHSDTPGAGSAVTPMQQFVSALICARNNDWESFATFEVAFPEGSVYRNILDDTVSNLRSESPRGIAPLPIRALESISDISLDTVEVIAECTNIAPQGTSAFFEPLLMLDSDGLIHCSHSDYLQLFPDTAQFMAFANHLPRLPEAGSIGAWSVELHDTDRPVKVHVRAAAAPLYEVVKISVSSEEYDTVRDTLARIKSSISGRPLLETSDGLIIRPRREIGDVIRDGVREPFDAWTTIPGFSLRGRTYAVGPLPQPLLVYDCSPLDSLIQRILALSNEVEGVPKLTKADIQSFAGAAHNTSTRVDIQRLPEVTQHLERHLHADTAIQALVGLVIQNPRIQREIAEAKENAAIQALSVRDDLKADIRRLQEERSNLEKSIRQRDAERQQLPARIARAVRKSFNKAKTEGLDTLGDLVVLSNLMPSVQGGNKAISETTGGAEPELTWAIIAPEGGSIADMLSRYGVSNTTADTLDRTIRIAIRAGQVIVLRGVAASVIADEIVRIVARKPGVSTTMPIGVLDPAQLQQHLSGLSESVGAIVIKLANHSDVDSYGSELFEYSVRRLVKKEEDNPPIILTLSDGPSALPLSMRLQRLALQLDLDGTVVAADKGGEGNLRDVIEASEREAGQSIWPPLRKRLNAAFDEIAKDKGAQVAELIRVAFVENAVRPKATN